METLTSSATILPCSSSRSSLPIFSPKPKHSSRRFLCFRISSKNSNKESDSNEIIPILSNRALSKDAAMGLVLSAALVSGRRTDSGMEGPQVSTLFTKSPRRRMLVAFTCNGCGQRTTRAINKHAYTDGTVFVQCCGCNVFHKLVDNLNLLPEIGSKQQW